LAKPAEFLGRRAKFGCRGLAIAGCQGLLSLPSQVIRFEEAARSFFLRCDGEDPAHQ
jgi:hypothetical protein